MKATRVVSAIAAIRTPDERFSLLPGFPCAPHYVEDLPGYEGLRMAYYDEGPKDATSTVLCLHGEPSWSYLYRKMLPVFTDAGLRVVCPDLFGFGRSDKPTDAATYTIAFHRNSLLRLIERLKLSRMTLVCQDWGGLLGLTLPIDLPRGSFDNVLAMNTGLPTGAPPSKGFMKWRAFAEAATDIPVAGMIGLDAGSTQMNLLDAMAYDAPFPDERYKMGVRRFPQLVPITPDMEGVDLGKSAAKWWRTEFQGKAFVAVGAKDQILGPPVMQAVRDKLFPQAPPLMRVEEGGHFVQEHGQGIAAAAVKHFFGPSSKL